MSIVAVRAGLSLLALSVWAAVLAQEMPVELAPVEVRATRTVLALEDLPGAITVIDGDDLRRGRMPSSLAEALVGVPGLFIQNAGNFSQDARIALRGFGAQAAFGIRGVAILVDGVPQTLPDGQAQVDSIDLAEVERIEILRGVILITTRPMGEQASASVRQDFGAFGRFDTHAALSAPVGPVGLRLSAGRFERDGFRDHSRVEQYRANLKLDWRPSTHTRIDATAGYFEAPEEQDPGSVTADQARRMPRAARDANVRFDAGETLEQWRFSTGVRHRLGGDPNHRLRLTGFAFLRDFANKLPFSGGGQVAFDRRFTGLDAQHEIQREVFGRNLLLTSGVDLRRQRDERERFDNLEGARGDRVLDQRERVDAIGVYAQAGIALAPRWRLTAGLRFDEVQLDVDDRLLVGAPRRTQSDGAAYMFRRVDGVWTEEQRIEAGPARALLF
ncbi:MAG: TonB-dependent receptor, partial [Wenzhouxiangellaceae bacterium]